MHKERLSRAVEFLESDRELYTDYVLGVEVPTTDSIIANQNLTDLEYYEVATDPEILSEIQSRAASQARGYLTELENENRDLEEYDISHTNRDSVPLQYASKGSIEHFDRYDPLLTHERFEESTYEELSDIEFQALRISDNREDEHIVLFQKFSNRQLSGNSDKLRMSKKEENYTQFEDTVVTVPETVDCMLYEGTIFVFAPKSFEDIFDYLTQYKRHADDVLTGIDDSELRIHNMDDFVESILGDRRVLRKMKSIEERELYNSMARTDVEGIVQEYDLSIEVETDDAGEWGITIPDMRKKWEVIRLLNDDHLESSLTDSQYQVYGKDERD
jgi:hypothetical protein